MGSTTGNKDRWEELRVLGEGGQGRVTLVRDKQVFKADAAQAAIHSAMKNSTAIAMRPSIDWFDRFRGAIIGIVNAELPENQGALKQLHDPDTARDSERSHDRMLREIDAMSQVSHPNLLRILDSNAEQAWYVSEFHPNGTLAVNNERFRGNFPGALRALRPLISGVVKLHEEKYVHRDIKPANIFISCKNELVLGDFGLVFNEGNDESRVSGTNENVGSRDWMPPWTTAVRAEEIPPSADVFSLGKVLWSMLTGSPILQLWFHDHPDYPQNNVEQILEGSPYVTLASNLFRRTIVERQGDCLPNARSLLELVDRTLAVMDAGADPISDKIERKCKVCGIGTYALIVDRNTASMRNFGIQAVGVHTLKIFACGNCGHVQMFSFEDEEGPKAWSTEAIPFDDVLENVGA